MSLQHRSTVFTPPTHHLLPIEIMALIFSSVTASQSTLYQYTLVNTSFYKAFNPMLWHSPQLINKEMVTRFLEGMHDMTKERCDTLGQLIHDLRLSHHPKDDYFIELFRPQGKSSYDHTGMCKDPTQVLHMPNLQHLTLSNCFGNQVLRHLLQQARLISLKLHRSIVTNDGFDALSQCPLEDFEWTIHQSKSSAMLQHLKPCPLRRLSIHVLPSTSPTPNPPILTPFARLMMDPSTFPLLTILELNGCHDINDQVLMAFFNNHPHLEQLHLSHQFTFTDVALDAIKLPRLTHASLTHLEHITAPAVRRLIKSCPLTYLDIRGCKQLKESDFPELGWERLGVLDSSALDRIRHSMIV